MNNINEIIMLFPTIVMGLLLVGFLSSKARKTYPEIPIKNKSMKRNSVMKIKRGNHSGNTRKPTQKALKSKVQEITELPPFNHPERNKAFKDSRVIHDRIGKHRLIPIYKRNNFIAVVTLTSKSYIGKIKNLPTENGYIGSELHHIIAKKDLTDNHLIYKSNVEYNEKKLLKNLQINKNNIKKYNEFIKKGNN